VQIERKANGRRGLCLWAINRRERSRRRWEYDVVVSSSQ